MNLVDQDKVRTMLVDLLGRLGVDIADVDREPIRVWGMSGVERLHLPGGETRVYKFATGPFAGEHRVLRHASHDGLPVPRVHNAVTLHSPVGEFPDYMGMVMDDLGEATREAVLEDAAPAAVAVHAVSPMHGRPVLRSAALAALPGRALDQLAELQAAGRWRDERIAELLQALAAVAEDRARDATIPPYGMVHSEFHPTSLLVASGQVWVLDMARAFTGPGLLDLASWQGTTAAPDLGALRELIAAYVTAGGAESALDDRAGLRAEEWAIGWHRIEAAAWFIEQALLWMTDPARDAAGVAAVVRHLGEASAALRA
jgi:hypothetical protein